MKRHREKMTIDGPRRQTSLVVQCFKLHASNAEVMGSILGQGTEITYAAIKSLHTAARGPDDSVKIPCAATKTWYSQVNTRIKSKKILNEPINK